MWTGQKVREQTSCTRRSRRGLPRVGVAEQCSLDLGFRGAPDLHEPCQAEDTEAGKTMPTSCKCAIFSELSLAHGPQVPTASEGQPPQPAAIVVASCPTICFRGAAADFETWQMWDATGDPSVRCYR
jgi:hypothetical protein